MIIFDGKIDGKAEAFFWKKARKLTITVMYITLCVLLPGILVFAVKSRNWIPIVGYGTLFILIPLITFIPKSDKEKASLLPTKIYTEDEFISCVVGGGGGISQN